MKDCLAETAFQRDIKKRKAERHRGVKYNNYVIKTAERDYKIAQKDTKKRNKHCSY